MKLTGDKQLLLGRLLKKVAGLFGAGPVAGLCCLLAEQDRLRVP